MATNVRERKAEGFDVGMEKYEAGMVLADKLTKGRVGSKIANSEESIDRLLERICRLKDVKEKAPGGIHIAINKGLDCKSPWDVDKLNFQALFAILILSKNIAIKQKGDKKRHKVTSINRKKMVKAGHIEQLVRFCKHENPKLQYMAARGLWTFSFHVKYRQRILDAGALKVIPLVIRAPETPNVYAATRCLQHLCQDELIAFEVLKTSIVYDLTDRVLVHKDPQTFYAGAQVLKTLVLAQPDHPAFVDPAFLERVLSMARIGDSNSKYAAIPLIHALSTKRDQLERFMMNGMMDILIEESTGKVFKVATVALLMLAYAHKYAEDRIGEIKDHLIALLASEDLKLRGAAARCVAALMRYDEMREAVKISGDFSFFMDLLLDVELQDAGADALNTILKDEEAALKFLQQGGMQTLVKISKRPQAMGNVMKVLWPLSLTSSLNSLIQQKFGSRIRKAAGPESDDVMQKYLACLMLITLEQNKPSDAPAGKVDDWSISATNIQAFAKGFDYDSTSLGMELTSSDLVEVRSMFETGDDATQLMCVWTFANLSVVDIDVFLGADGYDALGSFLTFSSSFDAQNLAKRALGEIDLVQGSTQNTVVARMDKFMAQIKSEVGKARGYETEYSAMVSDLTVRYQRLATVDKLELCETNPVLPSVVNANLEQVKALRESIDEGVGLLKVRLEGIGDGLKALTRDLDTFELMFGSTNTQNIDTTKDQLAELAKKIQALQEQIDAAEAEKARLEAEKQILVDRAQKKTSLEGQKVSLIKDLEDVQYRMDHFDDMQDTLQDKRETMVRSQEALKDKSARFREKRAELIEKIKEADEAVGRWAIKRTQYDDLVRKVQQFKDVRREMKDRYGHELNDMKEFHGFLNTLMQSGFELIKQLSIDESEAGGATEGSAPTRGANETFMDFGTRAEVELDEKVAELQSLMEGKHIMAKKRVEELKRDLASLKGQLAAAETEYERVGQSITKHDVVIKKEVTLESLEVEKANIQARLDAVTKEIAEIGDLDTSALHASVEDQAKIIGAANAEKRGLESRHKDLEKQLISLYTVLEGEVNKFARGFGLFKKSRMLFEVKWKPIAEDVVIWRLKFVEEKELTVQIEASVSDAIATITSRHGDFKRLKEDQLMLPDAERDEADRQELQRRRTGEEAVVKADVDADLAAFAAEAEAMDMGEAEEASEVGGDRGDAAEGVLDGEVPQDDDEDPDAESNGGQGDDENVFAAPAPPS